MRGAEHDDAADALAQRCEQRIGARRHRPGVHV